MKFYNDRKTNTLLQNECVRIDSHSTKFHDLGGKIHANLNSYVLQTGGNIEKLPDATLNKILRLMTEMIPNFPPVSIMVKIRDNTCLDESIRPLPNIHVLIVPFID